MAFDDLPIQPPLFPESAEEYARRALALSREAAARCTRVADVAYGKHPAQRLDIYLPSRGAPGPHPVMVFAHGGAWTNGYKEWLGLMGPTITDFPAVLVTISYRLAPEHRYPDPYDDCVAALAWVHRYIADYGGDPDRIHVGGHSSGGTLFSLVALRRDVIERAGLPPDVVVGCFPLSARFDLALQDAEPGSFEARHKATIFTPNAVMESFSPLHNITAHAPPFFIAHGDRDLPQLMRQADEMRRQLIQRGVRAESVELADHDHFDTALRIADPCHPWMRAVRDRLYKNPSTVPYDLHNDKEERSA